MKRWFLMGPAGDGTDGGGGGGGDGKIDRGDDFTPTGADAVDKDKGAPNGDPEAEKLAKEAAEAEAAAKAKAEAEAAAKAKKGGDGGDDGNTDDAKDGDDDDKKKRQRIPLERHEKILAKERERREQLERQLAASRRTEEVADVNKEITEAENKLVKAEAEYTKLVTDGEHEKAAAKMGEIRKLERSIADKTTEFKTKAAEARAYERVRYDMTVERLEEAYPFINPDHADYDEDKADQLGALRDGYVARGMSGAQALQKAAKTLFGNATRAQERATETDARVTKEDVAKKLAEERAAAAKKKAAAAAAATPPSSKDFGKDNDDGGQLTPEKVIKMDYNEFVKLDEKTLAKLRGDTVV